MIRAPVRRRAAVAAVVASILVPVALSACGASDNGGTLPVPGSTSSTAPGNGTAPGTGTSSTLPAGG